MCLFFSCLGGGVVFFCCLAGGVCSFFLLFGRGRVLLLLFGRGRVLFFAVRAGGVFFLFAVWAGNGSSLTYPSASSLSDPTTKETEQQKKTRVPNLWHAQLQAACVYEVSCKSKNLVHTMLVAQIHTFFSLLSVKQA